VVGPAPKQLESSGSIGIVKTEEAADLSEFLLLHHDYVSKTGPTQKPRTAKRTAGRKYKRIKPKVEESSLEVKTEPADTASSEMLYGTYDETTNCITIFVDDDDDDNVQLEEATMEIATTQQNVSNDHNYLKVPQADEAGFKSSSSDCGYESLGSPNSLCDVDLWDQSVSELFPSLL